MTGYIYCHTSPSKKSYIGQTTTSLQHRYNNGNNYQSSPIFWKAIKKYGWDNFEHTVIEKIEKDDKDELIKILNEKEKEYIIKFNTLVPNGYNIDFGGGQEKVTEAKKRQISSTFLRERTPTKEILEKLYVQENKTMAEVGEILNINREIVSKWLKWYNIPINYSHRNSKKIDIEKFKYYYIELNYTQQQCAELFGVSIGRIPDFIKKNNLYKRRRKK